MLFVALPIAVPVPLAVIPMVPVVPLAVVIPLLVPTMLLPAMLAFMVTFLVMGPFVMTRASVIAFTVLAVSISLIPRTSIDSTVIPLMPNMIILAVALAMALTFFTSPLVVLPVVVASVRVLILVPAMFST